jgi:membrane protein implicated in regulation of membrane protease activity
MESMVRYWYWLVLGMLLIIAELFIPSFTVFWFGLGALIVGGLLFFWSQLPVAWQLFIWAIASSFFTLIWFQWIRPLMADRTKAGLSREAAIGENGQVVKVPSGKSRGVVRFTTPLLGAEEWPFICADPVRMGERVFVTDISGNTLIVQKHEAK